MAAALALSGCVVGPNHPIPPSAVATAPTSTGPLAIGNKAVADEPLPDHWWRLYADDQLDRYVAEGLSANADLRTADANLRRAAAVIDEAKAARTVSTAIAGGAEASQVGNFTKPLPGVPYAYTLGLSLSYPLDLAGGIRRGIEAASFDADVAVAARDQVRVTIAAGITRSFLAACSANASLTAAQHVLEVQQRTLAASTRLQRGGRGTAFDVSRARGPVDQSRAALPSLIAERRVALLELAALMGRSPADYPKEAETCQKPPGFTHVLPVGDGAALLARRPDLRAAERRIDAAMARISIERAQLYPQVRLGGSFGSAGPIAQFGEGGTFGGSIGPFVSWSFPNRQAVRARIAEAGATADGAAAMFDSNVITALREVESAIANYSAELDRNQALGETAADARVSAVQADRLFRFGRVSFLDVLTAENQLAAAEAALALSNATLTARRVDVFLSLGGGWETGSGG